MASEATRCTAGSSAAGSSPRAGAARWLRRWMGVAELGEPVIPHPGIGDHCRCRGDMISDEGKQRPGRPVLEQRHPAPADPLGLADFDRDAGQDLLALSTPASQPGLFAADVGFIDLHRAVQPPAARVDQDRAEPGQHRPGRLVGADLQRPLQAERRDPVLSRGERPAGREPHGQRRARLVEDRAGRHRGRRRRRTCIRRSPVRQPPTPLHLRIRTRAASAATPGSPGSRHRCGTRPGTRLSSAGSAARLGPQPRSQLTPAKWRARSSVMRSIDLGRGLVKRLARQRRFRAAVELMVGTAAR